MKRLLLIFSTLCADLTAGLILWSLCTPLFPRHGLFVDRGALSVEWESTDRRRPGEPLTYRWSLPGIKYHILLQPGNPGLAIPAYRMWTVSLYWPLLLFSIAPTLWAIAWYRRHKQQAPGKCPQCGYDLRATPTRCPECGATIPTKTTEARPVV